MTSLGVCKNSENQFFRPKSNNFHPISMKLLKSVENIKTHILLYFEPNQTPLRRHNEGPKTPKISFLT